MDTSHGRSTNPLDYQDLPQTIGAMAKEFQSGYEIAEHSHERDQLLFASKGIMRLRTNSETWIIPQSTALYVPAGVVHSVSMHGDVHMRTLYIDAAAPPKRSRRLGVLSVSNLLKELILALSEAPVHYDPHSKAGMIAQLIWREIEQAQGLPLSIPLPKDSRLQGLCTELLKNPSDRRTLDSWADVVGASTRTLARLFDRELGMSFNKWRQRIRFHNALEALNRGDSISKVATNNGYNSASAFTYAFRKEMGVVPTAVKG
jgi:AraC-like DNA-binding protein/quercetin dioxygenase-like cupin family protein